MSVRYFFIFFICFLTNHLYATDYKISDGGTIIVADGDRFFDSGGIGGIYTKGESNSVSFQAPAGYDLSIEFTSFIVKNNDELTVFSGGISSVFTKLNNPNTLDFTSGKVQFTFDAFNNKSNNKNRDGWEAIVHLTPKTSSSIRISNGGSHLVNDPIRFYDSGGSGSNYPHNEISSINFSAPAGYDLVVLFLSYNTEATFDYLTISDGVSPLDKLDDINDDLKIVSSTGNLKFNFESDEYVNESGWEAIVYKREKPADIILTDSDVNEDAGLATVRVSLSKVMSSDVSFEWCTEDDQARQPSDYTRVSWISAKISAGELYVDLKVVIKDDDVYEGDEKFTVFLKNSVNAKINDDRISCTILDNESTPPELSIADINVDEDAGIAVFKARLNKPHSKNVEFQWSTANWEAEESSDYTKVGWTKVVIPAGDILADLRVTIFDDGKFEGDERFTCYLGYEKNVNLVKTNAICTIVDNDSNASIKVTTRKPGEINYEKDLVKDVLITGCLKADKIQFTGNQAQIGYFNKEDSSFPLGEGIVLSTGNVSDAEGPNLSSRTSTSFNGAGDSDLSTISGGTTKDAAVLEFDFIPAGDQVQFRYIFASEEYSEFACGNYNDVFAFLMSGPEDINGIFPDKINIALLEDGRTPVSINNVHGTGIKENSGNLDYSVKRVYDSNGAYRDGSRRYYEEYNVIKNTSCLPRNEHLFVDNGHFQDKIEKDWRDRIQKKYIGNGGYAVEYDGYTYVLTATYKNVTPCEKYHIKIAIADSGDDKWDSAVFLEAKSFVSNEVLVENRIDDIDGDKDVMYRGCDKSFISFSRKENLDEEYSFGVTITGSAVNGLDYYLLNSDGSNAGNFPDRITFPVGVSELKYYYMASDAVKGEKDILFEVLIGCPCNPDDADYFRKSVKIFDIAEIEASAVSNVTCNGGSAIATVIIKLTESLDPDNYLYSLDGSAFQTSNRFQGNFLVGDHQVVIKDVFSCKSKEVTINVPAPTALKAEAGENFEMCERDDTKELNGKGGIDYLWTCDKIEGLKDMDLTAPNPKISPLVSADLYTYTLTVSDGIGKACSSHDDVEVEVMATPTLALSADKLEVCSGTGISLNADVKNAINPTYQWTPIGEINQANQQNVIATPVTTIIASRTYSLEVTSDNGCHVKQSISGVQVSPLPIVTLNPAASNLCSNGTNGAIKLNVSGGTPEAAAPLYHYSWSHDVLVDTDVASGLAPNTYTVIVSDSKACQSQIDVVLKSEPKPKGIFVD